MYRRGYVALVGAGLLAGCGTGGGGTGTPTTGSAQTETGDGSSTDPAMAAAQSTATAAGEGSDADPLTGEQRAAAALGDAAAKVREAHEVYVGYGPSDATVLVDVGPETVSFNGTRIQTICRQAREHLQAGKADAATHQQPRIQRLSSAINWLSGAASIQEAMGSLAQYLRQAERTATGGAPLSTVASHLRSARGTIADVREAEERLDPLRSNAFEEFDDIDGDDVGAKHRQLRRETRGLVELGSLIDQTVGTGASEDEAGGAIGQLRSARAAFDAGEDGRAEDLATSAERTLRDDVLRSVDGLGPDSLQPLADSVAGATAALGDRARSLADEAAGQ